MMTSVIWDFHGTLADVSSVLPLVHAKDYDGFYEGSLSCPPNENVVIAARKAHEAGHCNLLFTGMPRKYEEGLWAWLKRHDVPIDSLSMREVEDGYRKDFIIKMRMYLEAVDHGYYAISAWEDSPAVIDMWGSQGIPVIAVHR